MDSLEFENNLKINLVTSVDLMFYHDLLKKFKASGGSQEKAYSIVNSILDNYMGKNEDIEDLVREILDFITGWCQKDMKVWENTLNI